MMEPRLFKMEAIDDCGFGHSVEDTSEINTDKIAHKERPSITGLAVPHTDSNTNTRTPRTGELR